MAAFDACFCIFGNPPPPTTPDSLIHLGRITLQSETSSQAEHNVDNKRTGGRLSEYRREEKASPKPERRDDIHGRQPARHAPDEQRIRRPGLSGSAVQFQAQPCRADRIGSGRSGIQGYMESRRSGRRPDRGLAGNMQGQESQAGSAVISGWDVQSCRQTRIPTNPILSIWRSVSWK